MQKSYRAKILAHALEKYGTVAEYPWMTDPGFAVLRRADSKKWYGIIMDVPRCKVGLSGDEPIDVMNIKTGPVLGGIVTQEPGIIPAYHMHKGNWVTVYLDGTVDLEQIKFLIDVSYNSVGKKVKRNG